MNLSKGELCYLRPLEYADIKNNYLYWLNDPKVCKNNGHGVFPYTEEQAREYVEFANRTRDSIILAIVDSFTKEHIGNIALQNIDHFHQTASLSILMGEKNFWGKGYAFEACQLIIEHGFSALNLNRIACGTMAGNVAMRKLAARLGFKEEGTRRQALYKNGEHVDVIEFGLLKNEWREINESRRTET